MGLIRENEQSLVPTWGPFWELKRTWEQMRPPSVRTLFSWLVTQTSVRYLQIELSAISNSQHVVSTVSGSASNLIKMPLYARSPRTRKLKSWDSRKKNSSLSGTMLLPRTSKRPPSDRDPVWIINRSINPNNWRCVARWYLKLIQSNFLFPRRRMKLTSRL